jgi:hypothetical protein
MYHVQFDLFLLISPYFAVFVIIEPYLSLFTEFFRIIMQLIHSIQTRTMVFLSSCYSYKYWTSKSLKT